VPYERRYTLSSFFEPASIAVIGASERHGSLGRTLLWNLLSTPFGGAVFPVSGNEPSVLGLRSYDTISALDAPVELAAIATPGEEVPGAIAECAGIGVKAVIVLSGGLGDVETGRAATDERIVEAAMAAGVRLLGPGSFGLMNPRTGLNATLAGPTARRGNVAFLTQSGTLGTAVLDWSRKAEVGFSAFVSVGSMLDVGWAELIDFFGDDPETRSILLYMESIGDARAFLSAAREVALTKPIIVIKSGRTAEAASVARARTGAGAESDEALDAALRRIGVLRVGTVAELFYLADVLAKQPRPRGPRLAIVTNAGGPAVLAVDALVAGGAELARLSTGTLDLLDDLLPKEWSRANPIDVLRNADKDCYARATEIALADPAIDGVLTILTPQTMADPTGTAERITQVVRPDKPLLASWMGGSSVQAGQALLTRANIPVFPYPDTAARVFASMWRYTHSLRALYETPVLPGRLEEGLPARARIAPLLDGARRGGRLLLDEIESRQMLEAYGIPVVETLAAQNEDEAVEAASSLGYPVTLKPRSNAAGVKPNLHDENAVRKACRQLAATTTPAAEGGLELAVQPVILTGRYELMIGSRVDQQFGPVLLFGVGGRLADVAGDRALALPPLTTTLARRMMERTRVYRAMAEGTQRLDLGMVEEVLVRLSHIVMDERLIRQIDVNPLIVFDDRLVALDVRIELHPSELDETSLPRPAIRPYPTRYVGMWAAPGATVIVRPIRPEDEPLMVRFHERLSERSVYFRYFHMLKLSQRVSHERLTRICFIDYDREMALVAEVATTGEKRIVGVARLTKVRGTRTAEFAVVLADDWQGRGLGPELLRRLIRVAKEEGLERLRAEVLYENRDMLRVCERLGMEVRTSADATVMEVEVEL
jgi:acetyltransferase